MKKSTTETPGTPPYFAFLLLRWFCPRRHLDDVAGDLEEIYFAQVESRGLRAARWFYWKEALLYCLWQGREPSTTYKQAWGPIMLKSYITIALRNLSKYKLYTTINVFGLSLGIACCILIFLFVRNEWTYDWFHANHDRIYRVNAQILLPDQILTISNTPRPLAGALRADFPEIEKVIRFGGGGSSTLVGYQDNINTGQLLSVDPDFFDMFSFPLLRGSSTVISQNKALILTEAMATKFFGQEDPIGRQMRVLQRGEEIPFLVAGVVKNPPVNSTISFDFIVIEKEQDGGGGRWNSFGPPTYIMLKPNVSIQSLEAKIPDFVVRHWGPRDPKKDGYSLQLQPLTDIHLNPEVRGGSDPIYTYILGGIALIILLIACINFMTLAIGRSLSRATEVGMRRIMGAQRGQIILQFWWEVMLLSFVALLLGFVMAKGFLPTFNTLAGMQLVLDVTSEWQTVFALLGITFVAGLIGGSYPILLASGFLPITALRGSISTRGTNRLSRVLVVVQFTLSIGLMVCTLVMTQQLDYIRNKNLGFNDDAVVVIPTFRVKDSLQMMANFKQELTDQPEIMGITGAGGSVARGDGGAPVLYEDKKFQVSAIGVGYDYIETLQLDIIAGRDFTPEHALDDKESTIVNEAFVAAMGWDDPIDKVFRYGVDHPRDLRVIGVMRDFHFKSLHEKIRPRILTLPGDNFLLVRVAPDRMTDAIALLKTTWETQVPAQPFQYYFLNEDVQSQYQKEDRWSDIIRYAMVFAFMVAGLGLFALSSLTVTKRTREIGIRKVLGASITNITKLLSRDFLRLVLWANMVAWPVGYFIMADWLQNFAYRIDIGVGTFFLAGILALGIAFVSVCYQAIKAAIANPVDTLRYE